MPVPAIPYRKLPGRSPSLRFGMSAAPGSTLWLGPDHVLLVLQTPGREEYRRFEYRDIQELFLQVSNRRMLINVGLALLVAILLVIAMLSTFGPVSTFLLFWVGGPALLGILINSLRGPACTGYLRTAVGVEPLGSLARLGPAQKAIAAITGEVERVQGKLEPSVLARQWGAAG